ncbi:Titin, partial [Lamprotornis superbus]
AERRKLRPGSGGEKPPEEPPFTYQLKAVPLKFVKEMKDIVLKEAESVGSSAIFEVLISPSTAITSWMKDGSNIRESPKHKFIADGKDRKLHIIDVQLSDAGEYTCVLRLGNKEKTSTAKLIVEELPVRFVKTLEEEVTVVKTQPLYLTCELNKERNVVWRKDGKIIKAKPGKFALGVIGLAHSLTVNDSDDADAGTYTVTVEDSELSCSSCVKVVEVIRDWLVKPIRDQHVKPKGTATFSCDIVKDTPNIKWFRGDEEIPAEPTDKTEILREGNKIFLKIKNAGPADVGEYAVEVEGRRYPAKLTLGEREVQLLKPLEDVTVYEKETANFDTEISEDDIPGEWKLKGEILRPSPTCEIKAEGGKRFLTLHKVKLDQAGEVLYQALNAVTTAILTVKEIELDFAVPLKDVTVPEKRQARFECVLTREANVIWSKGTDILKIGEKFDIIADGKKHILVINDSQFDDEGEYTAEVDGKKSTARLFDQTVKEGETAHFQFELSHEDMLVKWFKNDKRLHTSRTVLITSEGKVHKLEMREVTLDDISEIKAVVKDLSTQANLKVLEADPYFTVKLQDYSAVEKDDITLACELSKDVPVKWYKDGEELIASNRISIKTDGLRRILKIKKAAESDKGVYECDCGTDKTSANISVESRLIKVERPLYGVEVFVGETARFEIEISEPDVHPVWKLKGETLTPSPDCEILEDGKKHILVLHNCKLDMTGEVSFQAANAKSAANLKVKELPLIFITPLSDVKVFEKDEAKFECEVSREPKTFRWLKGTEEITPDEKFEIISDGTKHALIIKSVAFEDEVKYTFEAEDKRTSAKLIIEGIRLKFITPLKDVTKKERETAEFTVELSHENITVVWFKNDQRLHTSKVVSMTDDGKFHTLKIKDLTIDDTSQIKVEAMGKSSEAKLTVLEGDPYFTGKLQDYTAVEKDEVILQCEISKADAPVKWMKDGKPITASKNVVIKADGKKRILILKKALKKDIGQYTCDCGTDQTSAKLDIEDRDIEIIRPLYSVEVIETETARFDIEISEEGVHGNWKLKGEPLTESAECEIKEEGKKHFLTLYNVRLDQAGGVDFQAANAKSGAHLRVKPRVIGLLRPLKDVTVTAGESATFDCELSYEGIPVEWFLKGKKLEPSDQVVTRAEGRVHTLVLRDVKLTDAGEVSLTAKDFRTQANLFVKEPPVEFTKPLEDQTVEEEATAVLECEVSRENAKVKWFKNGEEIHKSKKYDIISDGRVRKLIIHGCTLDDAKTYACDAKDFKTSCFLNVE